MAAFSTTRWTLVIEAGKRDSLKARDALAKLCQAYWYPLYSYVRRRGHSAEDAEDLTQEFLFRLMDKNGLEGADRSKGRFRSFLLSAMKHFLADEWDRARAQKRGGGVAPVTLEFAAAETRYTRDRSDGLTPERSYELGWAVTLLEDVLNQLSAEYQSAGKLELFSVLRPCLVGERTSQPYAQLAETLAMSESAVKSAVHRLRQRYRELLRDAIADTVSGPEEVDDEMRFLFAVLSR